VTPQARVNVNRNALLVLRYATRRKRRRVVKACYDQERGERCAMALQLLRRNSVSHTPPQSTSAESIIANEVTVKKGLLLAAPNYASA
jgi:hypothetical protein